MEYLPLQEIARKAELKDEVATEYLKLYSEIINCQKSEGLILYAEDLIKTLKKIDKLKKNGLTKDQIIKILNKENSLPWWERIFKNFRSCSGD